MIDRIVKYMGIISDLSKDKKLNEDDLLAFLLAAQSFCDALEKIVNRHKYQSIFMTIKNMGDE